MYSWLKKALNDLTEAERAIANEFYAGSFDASTEQLRAMLVELETLAIPTAAREALAKAIRIEINTQAQF